MNTNRNAEWAADQPDRVEAAPAHQQEWHVTSHASRLAPPRSATADATTTGTDATTTSGGPTGALAATSGTPAPPSGAKVTTAGLDASSGAIGGTAATPASAAAASIGRHASRLDRHDTAPLSRANNDVTYVGRHAHPSTETVPEEAPGVAGSSFGRSTPITEPYGTGESGGVPTDGGIPDAIGGGISEDTPIAEEIRLNGTASASAPERNAVVTPSTTNIGPLRRVPVQGRSVARVARMLDACAELVDEVGYEQLTTTLLAERAGVAIGSIYQFFPDKRAVVQALTLRSLEAYLQRISGRLSSATFTHWWDGVDAAIDEYIDMHRTVPGFRTLHFGDVVDVHLLDEERDNNAVIASALVGLLVTDLDMQSGPDVEFAVMIAVEAADALIQVAFRRDPNGDPRVLAEAKSLIREYLQRQRG